jgi:DNA-directed RNA polymerase II subunit RPB2
LIQNFLSPKSVVQHQIQGFDWFVQNGIWKIINDEPAVSFTNETLRISLKFSNPRVNASTRIDDVATNAIVNVDHCRKTDSTYAFNVEVDICMTTHCHDKMPQVEFKYGETLMKLPIMIGSFIGEKSIDGDAGGYFIIKGKERVLFSQIRGVYDKMICHVVKGELICEMRSMCEETMHSTKICIKRISKKNSHSIIGIHLQYFSEFVPLTSFLKLFRNSSVHTADDILQRQYEETSYEESQQLILSKLSSSTWPDPEAKLSQILQFDVFPHLGISVTEQEIVNLLLLMVSKFSLVDSGKLKADNKEDLQFKRVESSGELLYTQFKINYKKILISTSKHLFDCYENALISQACKFSTYATSLIQNFSKGEWGSLKNNYTRKGVSQVIFPKSNQIGFISAMRKCVIPENKEGKDGKNLELRQISPTSSFLLCPCETPEGQGVGLVLNMALFAHISLRVNKMEIIDTLLERLPLCSRLMPDYPTILVNGRIIGCCSLPIADTMATLKTFKTNNVIPNNTGIIFDKHLMTVEISVDAGRMFRPVFNVKKILGDSGLFDDSIDILLQIPRTDFFQKCVESGWICFVDVDEVKSSKIVTDVGDLDINISDMEESTDFLELSPVGMLGYIAAQIPYANRTQSSRNCFQSSMIKQAIGSMPDFATKLEIKSHSLFYPQIPLITTSTAEQMGVNDFPNGINAIVALCCYSGFNQEDCIIIKRGFVERGAFQTLTKSVVSFSEKRSIEEISFPSDDVKNKRYNYDLLDDKSGIVKPRSSVTENDVLIGVIDCVTQKDKSVAATEDGFVQNVFITKTLTGRVVKVELIKAHSPETGDKFLSSMAQKGTCRMMDDQDLPFSSCGMIPDIIINPNCIPGRMTINQLIASVMAKGFCFSKKKAKSASIHPMRDATPFQDSDAMKELLSIFIDKNETLFWFNEMAELGFDLNGTETLTSGFSGEMMKSAIFMGPLYYFVLTHKVSGKIHARGHDGPKTAMFRQPAAGRRNGGGMRWGEMETDAVTAYGATTFLHESLTKRSDHCFIFICKRCQTWASRENFCNLCFQGDEVVQIPFTHSSLILFRNIEAMGIGVKFEIDGGK